MVPGSATSRRGTRAAFAAAIVTNASLLPTSYLRRLHEHTLMMCEAAYGAAVREVQEDSSLAWDNIDSPEALEELVEITIDEMP